MALAKIPEWAIGIGGSIIAGAMIMNAELSSVKTQVEANTKQIDQAVSKDEFKAIKSGQDKMNDMMEKRLDKIDNKLDKILEK